MAKYSIGRSEQNTVTIDDQTVSRQHAELETKRGGKFILRDLGSTYGTKILRDGEWIDVLEIEVTADTQIVLGEHQTTAGTLAEMANGGGAKAAAAAAPAAAAPAAAPAAAASPAAAAPAPAGGGGPKKDRTTMWILIGGGALLLVVIIAVVLILVLEEGPTRSGATRPGTTGPGTTPGGAVTRFQQAMVAECERRGRFNSTQCRCAAKVIVANLTPEELRFMNLIVRARNDQAQRAKIMKEFGQQKAIQISLKFAGVMKKVTAECGFDPNKR